METKVKKNEMQIVFVRGKERKVKKRWYRANRDDERELKKESLFWQKTYTP